MIDPYWASLLTQPRVGYLLRVMRVEDKLPRELAALVGVQQDPTHHPEGDAFEHTCHVVDAMRSFLDREFLTEKQDLVFMLAALTHDMGKATTTVWNEEKEKWTAYGHDLAGVPIAHQFLVSVGAYHDIITKVLPLVRWHMAHCRQEFTEKAVRKLARELGPMRICDLVVLLAADCAGRPPIPPGLPPVITQQLVPMAAALGLN